VTAALRVFIMRHGETTWSLSGQHTGGTELPMVRTSPRLRTRQTCELAGFDARVRVDPDPAEWDYDDHEGQRSSDIRVERPDWDIWRDGRPGGETPTQVGARADRVIAHLMPLVGAVALFSHGQFARVLAARWLVMDVGNGRRFAPDPASISMLGFEDDAPDLPVIALWNASPAALGSVRASQSVPC
jgi:probable phosphoglycerate mutase